MTLNPSDRTPEQKLAHAKYRAKARAKAKEIYRAPSASEWRDEWATRFPDESAEVNAYVKEVSRKVADELGIIQTFSTFGWSQEKFAEAFPLGCGTPESYAVDQVARTLFGFQKPVRDIPIWIRAVTDPTGDVVSGFYSPEDLGIEIVGASHRYNLEKSQTFSALYRELLKILDERYGSESKDSRTIKSELAGTFILFEPLKMEPETISVPVAAVVSAPVVPVPVAATPVPVVNWSQIKDLDDAARRYLEGIK